MGAALLMLAGFELNLGVVVSNLQAGKSLLAEPVNLLLAVLILVIILSAAANIIAD